MKFGDFYAGVEFDLRQRDEAEVGSSDDSKPLPFTEAKRITNEAITYLLGVNPNARDTVNIEYTVAIEDRIEVPSTIIAIHAYKINNGSWTMFDGPYANTTTLHAAARSLLQGKVAKGDVITFKAVLLPEPIIDEDSVIDFPMNYIELLRKHVVIEAASIVGQTVSQLYLMRYTTLFNDWKGDRPFHYRSKINRSKRGKIRYYGKF